MSDAEMKILLVEDNLSDAKVIMKELDNRRSAAPVLVEHVERLSLALECVQKKEYDIILTDLKLPDSDGLETVRRLLEQAPKIPLIVLTATYEQEALAVETIQLGAQDYLFKDKMDGALLIRVIRYAIERHRIQEALIKAKRELEAKILELENLNNIMMGREERILELKEENKQLKKVLETTRPKDERR